VQGRFGDTPVFFIYIDDLLANKKASGRDKDLADVSWIEKYRGK